MRIDGGGGRPKAPTWSIGLIAGTILAVLVVAGVRAHAGLPDLIVTPPIVEPGDEITIQAGALWTELPIDVTLVDTDGRSRAIGSGATAPDGSLSMTLVMPERIRDGAYQVMVTNRYGETNHGAVVVRSSVPVGPIVVVSLVAVSVLVAAVRIGRGLRKGGSDGRRA